MSRRLNWLWPVLVVALFCLPLFIGLDHVDLRGDEAAHSFTVERILETGDWLIPRISPFDYSFVEKPPLKFWIVAAGIRLGLPHNEFGLRFWDALLGGVAFFYVFLIGRRLAGPVCGTVAVLMLFVHGTLLLEHGLRDNDMEAAVLLCYCGGFYHYFEWTSSEQTPKRLRPALTVGLYFALGFMVKFVAALFLPFVLGVASLVVPAYRGRFARDWRLWSTASLLALVLIVPWYAYGHYTFGLDFWRTIFGAQVVTRLTGPAGLDPNHVHPWSFYFTQLYENLTRDDTWLLALGGGILLLVETIRRRWTEGFVVLLWFALPLGAISLATSKLYHYAYPYLPPVALAGGYLLAVVWLHLHPLARRLVADIDQRATNGAQWVMAARQRPVPRRLLLSIAAVASVVLAWTVLFGPIRISAGSMVVFKSGSVFRPWIIAVVCGVLGGASRQIGRFLLVPLLLLLMLPLQTYRDSLARLRVEHHPTRSARDCIESVRAAADPSSWRGVYVAGPDSAFGHGDFYYFRTLSSWVPLTNWVSTPAPAEETLYKYLYDPSQQRPVLLATSLYGPFRDRLASGGIPSASTDRVPPGIVTLERSLVLLPGLYARCGATASSSNP